MGKKTPATSKVRKPRRELTEAHIACIVDEDHARLAKIQELWAGHLAILKGGGVSKLCLTAATGYWMGYQQFAESIHAFGHKPEIRGAAYMTLNESHRHAVWKLMEAAESVKLDGGPILSAAEICRRVYSDVVKWPNNGDGLWPDCLGESFYSLPAIDQESVRRGNEIINRLSVKLGISPIGVSWSKPVSLAIVEKAIGVSRPTLKNMLTTDAMPQPGKYRYLQIEKLIILALSDLPESAREKLR